MTDGGLTTSQLSVLKSLENRHRREMRIVLAIFDDTPSHTVQPGATMTSEVLKGALTTFAKVDLLDRATNIRAMGYDVAVCPIKPYPTGGKKRRTKR